MWELKLALTGCLATGSRNLFLKSFQCLFGSFIILRIFIFINKTIEGGPACAAGNTGKFVTDPDTPGGKAIVATALIAQVKQTLVTIVGLGTCPTYPGYGDTEMTEYISLPD